MPEKPIGASPSVDLKFPPNSLGYQPTGDHGRGHSGTGMSAGSHEVQVLVARMPVGGPEIGHLRQRVRQPMR